MEVTPRGPWLYQDAALKGKASVRSEVWDGAPFSTDSSHDLPKTFSDLNSKPRGAGHFQLSLRKQLLWPNCLLEDVQSHFYKAIIKRLNFSILHWRYSFSGTRTYFFIRRPRTGNSAFQPLSLRHSESSLADVTLSKFYSNLNVLSASFLLDLGNMTNQQI